MNFAIKNAPILACVIVLGGCIAPYQTPPISQTIPLNVSELMTPQICINHNWYLLSNSKGITRVPYGQRISIANNYFVGGSSCMPVISFVPQQDQEYYATFTIDNSNNCVISILQGSSETKQGLNPPSSLGPDEC